MKALQLTRFPLPQQTPSIALQTVTTQQLDINTLLSMFLPLMIVMMMMGMVSKIA